MLVKSHIEGGTPEIATAFYYESARANYFERLGSYYDDQKKDAQQRRDFYFDWLQRVTSK